MSDPAFQPRSLQAFVSFLPQVGREPNRSFDAELADLRTARAG
jgi:hypothetical protein